MLYKSTKDMKRNKKALITGGSKGLGFQLARALAQTGWDLLVTARNAKELLQARKQLPGNGEIISIAGDVRDEVYLLELSETLNTRRWELDLVVNNASTLGLSPLRNLLDHSVDNLHLVFHTNVIAPISLLQKVKPHLKDDASIVNISSDAAVEAYEQWGAYGGSKAGLDHITAILGKENPDLAVYSFDPGDMRTDMHQAAFPDQDISDRPLPKEFAVPALLRLINRNIPSGRYTLDSLKVELA